MNRTAIPGNRHSSFGRIWADTTREALVAHRTKLVSAQAANMRGNARFVAEIRRLDRAIAAR